MFLARRAVQFTLALSLSGISFGCGGGSQAASASTTTPGQGTIAGASVPTGTSPLSTALNPSPSASPSPSTSPSPAVSSSPTSSPTPGGASIQGCPIFPADNPWNQDISSLPVDPNSANYMAAMNGGTRFLHPDFGSDPTYGIPFAVVGTGQPLVPMNFVAYPTESDAGPYPFPPNAAVEGGVGASGDRHVLVVDKDNKVLYETYRSFFTNPGWTADNGARFDLTSNKLRPDHWTSADAAGLPIFPGLAKYDECVAGQIQHALRFTVHATQAGFIHPATHFASASQNANLPPMGLRVRLKANFSLANFSGHSLVILTGLKRYGMIVADNGSDWYISGATDGRWNDNDLNQLKKVPASAFEVVTTGAILH